VESWNKLREFPGESSHLPIGHVKKEVDTGHPLDKEIRILEWTTSFTGVHLIEVIVPVFDEIKGEVKLSSPNQAIVIWSNHEYLCTDVPTALSLS